MKILISTGLPVSPPQHQESLIKYLPEDVRSQDDLDRQFSRVARPDVWIAAGKEVTKGVLHQWRGSAGEQPLSLLIKEERLSAPLQKVCDRLKILVSTLPGRSGQNDLQWGEEVLKRAESLFTTSLATQVNAMIQGMYNPAKGKDVVLVGAGIVNLMTAELLASKGYKVKVVDRCPDPRCCTLQDWTQLGVTFGGGNARMFTYTEADNYNEKGSEIYQDMAAIFRTTGLNGGWVVKDPARFSKEEDAWVNLFEQIPPWLARIYSQNIFSINHDSGELWKDLMQRAPELFEDVEYYPDILRMYVEPVAVDAAVKLNSNLGALLDGTSLEEFLAKFPGFRPAAQMDELAGGITVKGFTVNVHPFMFKLMERISGFGGEFIWGCEISDIERNPRGEVAALLGENLRIEGDHYIMSPGVRGSRMLGGTESQNIIQGVLGVWLQIPNLEPKMKNSIKIHRRGHLVEDINITVAVDPKTGEDILIFGGGYGYVGRERPAHDSPELKALFDELENVARIYFPKGYEAAKAAGSFYPEGQHKYCIRPFTPTGLGVFELLPAHQGGKLIVTGGHNTGGFAQSPAVARAVLAALEGRPDPMHAWFHPSRSCLSILESKEVKARVS